MNALLLYIAALVSFENLPAPRLGPSLPACATCELIYRQAESDYRELEDFARPYGHDMPGWLSDQLCRSERAKTAWYKAWWITWPQATEEQHAEHCDGLRSLIGEDAYTRGVLPLPPSVYDYRR